MGPDDSAAKPYPQGRGRLHVIRQKDTGHTHLERPRACILLKWQQPDFKRIKPFCKGAQDLSTPAEAGSGRHPMPFLKLLGQHSGSFKGRDLMHSVPPTAPCWLSGTPGVGKERSPSWPMARTQLHLSHRPSSG